MRDKPKQPELSTTDAEPKAKRQGNPELLIMGKLDRIITALDIEARKRVLDWLWSSHGGGRLDAARAKGEQTCRDIGYGA